MSVGAVQERELELPRPGGALLPAPHGGQWRPHLRGDRVELVLLAPPGAVPLELQLLARVLDEATRRALASPLKWRWARIGEGAGPSPGELWVLADEPQSPGASRWLDAVDAAVFIGPAATWFAGTAHARGRRVAMHWEDAGVSECAPDAVVPSPAIIEVSGRWTTCAGGFAVVDLALLILQELTGGNVALQVMDAMCLDRLRAPDARQRSATSGVLSSLSPKLAEAVALMEANVEDWLQTDEVARRVGVSRRQLERLFKQHLNTLPARHYLDIRLQRARKLLRETSHSLVQVGLMCGFASASHFSTTYGSVFGITPREERQRLLAHG